GSRTAATWIKSKFQDYGATCEYMEFLDGFAPNVICKYAAQQPEVLDVQRNNGTSPRIIISAHYDSRGSFGSTRAPGADDDGSGVVQLLAIARAIQKRAVKFNTDVELVTFAGEEQGLLGKKLYEEGADIVLMIQADMLAYHSADEPMQLGLPEWIGSPVAAALLSNISSIYVPDLTVGTTSACCSDHQSFWQY
ncbi:9991_t:CDS:2, partial [Acaulospora colombiana]